jgi:hypothetical protein
MGALPEVTRILKEDLVEPSQDLETVINAVNTFMESTYDALRDLDFQNNFRSTIKNVNVLAADASNGLYPINVNISDFNTNVKGVIMMRALRTDLTYFSSIEAGITVNWRQDGNSLIIEEFGGLPFTSVTDRYTITILVI